MGKKKGKDRSSKEENCIELTGPTCSHIRKGIDHILFKKTAPDVDWSLCQDCQEGPNTNSEDEMNQEPQVIWMCLKCGHRGCGRYSEDQHAVKHYETPRSDPHCLVLNLDNWTVWCYICDDDVQYSSTGQLAQLVTNIKKLALSDDARQKPKTKEPTQPSISHNDLQEEESNHLKEEKKEEEEEEEKENKGRQKKNMKKDTSPKGKKTEPVGNSGALSVRGLSNLGNTCFFNAVVQNLSQTQFLRQVLSDVTHEKITVTLTPSVSSELEPIKVQLDQPGSLTLTMWQLLNEIQENKKGVVTPRELFTQVCKKAARFKGFQQQDSQELLRYLLDGMRAEEIKRFKAGISEALKSSGKNADSEESKTLMKNYEKNGALKNFVDQVFGGEMTSTVMCKECKTVSVVTEMFLDLSLPVSDEAYRKKNQKKVVQRSSVSDDGWDSPTPLTNGKEDMPTGVGSKYQQKKAKKQAKKQNKNQRRQQKQEVKVSLDTLENQDEMAGGDAEAASPSTATEPEVGGETDENTQMDSEQPSEVDHSEQGQGKMDESPKGNEGQQQQQRQDGEEDEEEAEEEEEEEEEAADESAVSNRFMALAEDQSSNSQTDDGRPKEKDEEVVKDATQEPSAEDNEEEEEQEEEENLEEENLAEELNHLSLNGTSEPGEAVTENGHVSDESPEYTVVNQDPEKAFHTLATRAAPDKQECSVDSSLFQFTEVEHLTQSNSLLCLTCTKRQSGSEGSKKSVYRDALKQMLISSPPPVLTLHLKRFQQVGYSVCKVNRHVQFPQLLDLAPYCSVNCKNVPEGMTQVLYSLYGIVEHSGTMRSGHYTAYVKARPHCQNMAPNGLATQGNGEPPKGSWFYISDSSVQPVTEAKAQSSQAYLLFYERIS
ncbi:ubiquitin carboxyl-terminal hydrolase 16 [Sardina pilchardus]|uniref:ubiquitin carboxyl-terminal hydrolase 16 n=1 Tax=Sardina pilchardus TaxID=27697 RepID=UPI002E0EDA33